MFGVCEVQMITSPKYTALTVPPTQKLNSYTPKCEHWDKRQYGFELMTDEPGQPRAFKYVCELCVPRTETTTIFR